ncbi:TetR/AcrR family transcriptional regulator [Methylobacterium sp. 88A]|uniref:TetR/AcrR family transcriptional regulator n=2 Tax=Methylobacterium TaxID=407 RepID=UPI00036F8899|nr:TetR/AcrR family transcriptional regulator [Methylobacterium sp. 88A]SFT28535.1 transcriptional regulator, TetR family [Methylobacterium sp. yr668]
MILAAHDPMGSATPPASPIRGRRGSDRKERLLRAACRVLLRHGVQALTLEAVAREARTSKGGLLHHFPSKARLRASLLDDQIDRLQRDLLRLVAADPDPRGRRLRAYVQALVAPDPACDRSLILAALLSDPEALHKWQGFSDAWLGPDLNGIDPGRADAVRALVEGSWLALALGLGPADPARRAAALKDLLRLAQA